jgi:hypothetical protein
MVRGENMYKLEDILLFDVALTVDLAVIADSIDKLITKEILYEDK